MLAKNNSFKKFLKIFLFIPLIFYYGKRSYIAYDEGFYALQARWIIEKGNWIIPLWWDEYILDRTNGLQILIAKSQQIFGRNMFAAYLPTTIAAILMLILTYKLHEEFFGKNHAIVSPLILSTTYLWFDYSHLATQDIIYSCLVTIGIFALVKIKTNKSNFYILLFGLWIGLAFMMKTFMVAVPLAALSPYLFINKNLFFTKSFWFGLIIGFIPYLIWAYSLDSFLDQNSMIYLFQKFNILSNKNNFTKPFYYYFWNIPVTFLPWSMFSITGLCSNNLGNKNKQLLLTYFPIIVIIILSIFSTKTPYYPLQISSVLSINAYIGIKYLFSSKKYNSIAVFITLIIGPYLLTSLLLQSGLFTDRSRELRETMEYLSSLDILKNKTIQVDKSSFESEQAQSKIIRISLLTPNLGDGINNIDMMNVSEFAWSTFSSKKPYETSSYQIIYDFEILSPWKLIKKTQ